MRQAAECRRLGEQGKSPNGNIRRHVCDRGRRRHNDAKREHCGGSYWPIASFRGNAKLAALGAKRTLNEIYEPSEKTKTLGGAITTGMTTKN